MRTFLRTHSLGLGFLAIFVLALVGQSIAGWHEFNATRLAEGFGTLSWPSYLGHSDFWSLTLQNWQSEFLAVGSMAVLAIYLRHRGSPESKPVGAPHDATGIEG